MESSVRLNNIRVNEYSSKFVGAVLIYFGLGLLLTSLVAAGVGYIYTYVLPMEQFFSAYTTITIVSAIGLIVTSIWMNVSSVRDNSLVLPFTIYATLMGILLSDLTMFYPYSDLITTLGITCGTMLIVGIAGWCLKKQMSRLAYIASIGFIGLIFLSLINTINFFISPDTFQAIYVFISFAAFIFILIFTAFDIYRIRTIAENGYASRNMALYCAFSIYTDFIYIFIRVLRLVVRSRN